MEGVTGELERTIPAGHEPVNFTDVAQQAGISFTHFDGTRSRAALENPRTAARLPVELPRPLPSIRHAVPPAVISGSSKRDGAAFTLCVLRAATSRRGTMEESRVSRRGFLSHAPLAGVALAVPSGGRGLASHAAGRTDFHEVWMIRPRAAGMSKASREWGLSFSAGEACGCRAVVGLGRRAPASERMEVA